ncbi:hypothetical protein GCM10022204_43220 [Microlunatus aurantiacus]|uniref:BioF2-like acetyltransferase domain-containing protein n=1 Tax=Microlunatus aurantiacus TaxID=446786 RepID=A0ABP7EFN7_9ACTN
MSLRRIRERLGGLRGAAGGQQHLSVEEREAMVSDYFQGYVENGNQRWLYAFGHPLVSFRALKNFLRLPRLQAELSDSVGGRAIDFGLCRERPLISTPIHRAASVLVLPDEPAEYSLGKSKQTLRRKCRAAEKAGVTWSLVTDPVERERLADLADQRDLSHPRDEYRRDAATNRSLLVHPLMLAAYAADGRPIFVSFTPTDGEWSLLQYFRTLEDSDEASNTRYLMTRVLAEHLIERGVRYLADNSSPMGVYSGLRHFQRMLGFRIYRVDRRRARAAVTSSATTAAGDSHSGRQAVTRGQQSPATPSFATSVAPGDSAQPKLPGDSVQRKTEAPGICFGQALRPCDESGAWAVAGGAAARPQAHH